MLKEDYKPSNDNLNKSKSITRSNPVSPALNKTNEILDETKELGLNLDEEEMEGGEGDYEDKFEEEASKKVKISIFFW